MNPNSPKLLLATRNKGKVRELTKLLEGAPFELVGLDDVGITQDVEETGRTFEENALLKARAYADLSNLPTLAEDSGIEVRCPGRRARTPICQVWRPGPQR